jgi:hypothetical protein
MKPYLLPLIPGVLLAVALLPACVVEKGDGTAGTGTSGGTGGSSEASSDPAVTTGVLTSTVGATTDETSTGPGQTTGSTTDTSSSGGTSDTTGTTDATTGEPAIMCGGEDRYFPTFDRTCRTVNDCDLVYHQVDCCGSMRVLGIRGEVAKAFGEAEAECVAQYPECDCLPQFPIADDEEVSSDINLIEVECAEGECRSFVP